MQCGLVCSGSAIIHAKEKKGESNPEVLCLNCLSPYTGTAFIYTDTYTPDI